jgi:hypothetical protein
MARPYGWRGEGVRKRFYILFVTVVMGLGVGASFGGELQALQREWVRSFSVSAARTNQSFAIALAPDGNVVIGGSVVNESNNVDYVVVKYRPNGTVAWEARYDSGGEDVPRSMTLDPAGNVIVTGTSKTVKYSSAGVFRWASPSPGRSVVANTNFVYVTGGSDIDFHTVQLANNDSNGTNIWTKTFDGGIGGMDVSYIAGLNNAEAICRNRDLVYRSRTNLQTLWFREI